MRGLNCRLKLAAVYQYLCALISLLNDFRMANSLPLVFSETELSITVSYLRWNDQRNEKTSPLCGGAPAIAH